MKHLMPSVIPLICHQAGEQNTTTSPEPTEVLQTRLLLQVVFKVFGHVVVDVTVQPGLAHTAARVSPGDPSSPASSFGTLRCPNPRALSAYSLARAAVLHA